MVYVLKVKRKVMRSTNLVFSIFSNNGKQPETKQQRILIEMMIKKKWEA